MEQLILHIHLKNLDEISHLGCGISVLIGMNKRLNWKGSEEYCIDIVCFMKSSNFKKYIKNQL